MYVVMSPVLLMGIGTVHTSGLAAVFPENHCLDCNPVASTPTVIVCERVARDRAAFTENDIFEDYKNTWRSTTCPLSKLLAASPREPPWPCKLHPNGRKLAGHGDPR